MGSMPSTAMSSSSHSARVLASADSFAASEFRRSSSPDVGWQPRANRSNALGERSLTKCFDATKSAVTGLAPTGTAKHAHGAGLLK